MKTKKNNFTLLFLKENFKPQSFKISDKKIKLILISVVILLLALGISISTIIGIAVKNKVNPPKQVANISDSTKAAVPAPEAPHKDEKTSEEQITDKAKIEECETRIKQLGESTKVSQATNLTQEEKDSLIFYSDTVKILKEKTTSIEMINFAASESGGKTKLTFNLRNNKQGSSVSGFINIIAISPGTLNVYPEDIFSHSNSNPNSKSIVEYDSGETFQVSRFRAVNADFVNAPLKTIKEFKIFIFNQDGILLNYKSLKQEDLKSEKNKNN